MKSFFDPEFQKFSKKLPPNIRKKAQKAFDNFKESDQSHFSRGLEFKRIQGYEALYSIRIDDNYCALGHRVGNIIYWE